MTEHLSSTSRRDILRLLATGVAMLGEQTRSAAQAQLSDPNHYKFGDLAVATLTPGTMPFDVIMGLNGRPLNGGRVYIGQPDKDPEQYPQPVYWGAEGQVPAAQPLETSDGYVVRAGTPSRWWTESPYSITVRDRQGRLVFYDRHVSPGLPSGLVREVADSAAALLASTEQFSAGSMIMTADGHTYKVANPDATDADLVTAGGVKLYVVDNGTATVGAFGAVYSGDESAIAQKMVQALGVLRVPAGKVLTCKNIELSHGTRVRVDGALRLPDGCVDFDRLLHATSKTSLDIRINEIDGNFAGQSGVIGTHLIYLVGCYSPKVRIHYAHDHYINSGAPMLDVAGDGRNTSTGAIWLHDCKNPDVIVDRLIGWGREGLMFNKCKGGQVGLGYALGTGGTEYSGLQANNEAILLLYAHVENAGASAVGFDVVNGRGGNIYVKNCREQHGVNLGHPGFPATGTVLENITVDGAWVGGIRVGANSEDVSVVNYTVLDAERGLQASDGVPSARFTSGVVRNSGRWNVVAGGADVFLTAVDSADLDPRVVQVTGVTGQFAAGETITGPSGSGVIRRVLNNLTGVKQRLHLSFVSGTFAVGSAVTGGTSGATGSVEYEAAPLQYLEQTGGRVIDDSRAVTSGTGTYVRHADGTAEFWCSLSIAVSAPDTDSTGTFTFPATMTWTVAPIAVADVASASVTGGYAITKKQVVSGVASIAVTMRASVAQSYGVTIYARGRWK